MNFRNTFTRSLLAAFSLLIGAQAFADRTTTYYHTDGLGSVVAATNQAGQVLWRKDYAPFGAQIDTTPETERTSYTGKQHDDVTGLTYFGARYFDPEIGRFMGIDPVGFRESNPISFNRYAYANNNPYRFIDPDGRQSAEAECDETCEYEKDRQHAARGARAVAQGASDAADIVDREASDGWNWIPWFGGVRKVAPVIKREAQVLKSAGAAVNRTVKFETKQLQAKFAHAADFGVTGSWNKNAGATFQKALQGHLDNPETIAIMGTYRGAEVTHFVNPTTGLNVMRGMDDDFVSGWRLNSAQLENVLTRGSL